MVLRESDSAAAPALRCQIDRSADRGYHWRLTTTNGRVVAISAEGFAEYALCLAAFDETCGAAGDLVCALHHTPDGSGWTWYAREPGGRLLARSARSYERHSTCQRACDRFRALLRDFVATGRPGWQC